MMIRWRVAFKSLSGAQMTTGVYAADKLTAIAAATRKLAAVGYDMRPCAWSLHWAMEVE